MQDGDKNDIGKERRTFASFDSSLKIDEFEKLR